MTSQKRLFVADPICALKFGHNLTLLRWYMERYRNSFNCVEGAVTHSLPDDIEQGRQLLRPFRFLYHAEMPLPGSPWATPRGKKLNRIWLRENRALRRFVSRKLHLPVMADPLASQARTDWTRFWRKYSIGPNDSILLPGADYYATRALLRILSELPAHSVPRIHLRFMNVMENAAGSDSIDLIARDLMLHGRVGDRLTISAETDAYARFLSARIQYPVMTIGHPINSRQKKTPSNIFTVAAVGAGRGDKGFMRLADIIELHAGMHPSSTVRFVIQSVNPSAREYKTAAHTRLANLPNVELLPHSISHQEIHRRYNQADLCILPYCPDTYAMRGSAVVPEAISAGCLLLASDNTAFSPIVTACGGRLANDNEEFASAIRDLSALPAYIREEIITKAYDTYSDMFTASMARLDRCLGI